MGRAASLPLWAAKNVKGPVYCTEPSPGENSVPIISAGSDSSHRLSVLTSSFTLLPHLENLVLFAVSTLLPSNEACP